MVAEAKEEYKKRCIETLVQKYSRSVDSALLVPTLFPRLATPSSDPGKTPGPSVFPTYEWDLRNALAFSINYFFLKTALADAGRSYTGTSFPNIGTLLITTQFLLSIRDMIHANTGRSDVPGKPSLSGN